MVPDFMNSWLFIGVMAVLLVVLIVVWMMIRNRREED